MRRAWQALTLLMAVSVPWVCPDARAADVTGAPLEPLTFNDLAGWAEDNHGAAFAAFRRSCERIDEVDKARAASGQDAEPHTLSRICQDALALDADISAETARGFFETHFTPHRVGEADDEGFLTGYFEPVLPGSRTRTKRFTVPVYARPDDLVSLAPDTDRARLNDQMTAGRQAGDAIVPYATRREIEEGALAGRGLELLYLADPVEAFFMHIQGSGRIALEDGTTVRLSYAAKNGHAYTGIGRILVERGEITREAMTADALKTWLTANPDEGRALMWENRSYIFFRELEGEAAALGPIGAQRATLTDGRSLAVDTEFHALGTPVWVAAPTLDVHGASGFHRLMVAQDVGSAIRGPQRGDIYWGSGDAAGAIAGATRHKGRFFVLLPKDAAAKP